ncbi:Ap3d1 protein [Epithele typhae]|uniref:Ap3d1 protein n=1 Tax=Epithele typhae TaxID=378194 RepID=UPI002008407D|nr:Ap3d1 protein [Epithele typhae]KAH9932073.1 Ap3d1 protein [Epithele typhae]
MDDRLTPGWRHCGSSALRLEDVLGKVAGRSAPPAFCTDIAGSPWECGTLQDLIRGLRANKKDESKFIAQAVDEIRQEMKSRDMEIKAAAVLKLTYLHMLGYDMNWASFHVVEVMSAPRIHLKTVGYLAAAQSFQQDTDVIMLTTNLLKKDLGSRPDEAAVALNGLSHIVTPGLARDLSPELIAMLNHSRPHIRKRAVLAMYKVFTQYPEVLPQSMSRLKDKLDDDDPSVVAATVNVLCELAHQNPQDYLPLAPQLFHLLTTTSNNWMLIKIIKLFGTLTPYERRLVKKLQPPITDLISTTSAISLLYECVRTCIIGGMLEGSAGNSLARTCVSKLAGFLQDPDQNLKYIALLAMVEIVPTYPELVAEYQDMILSSVNDEDISIRMGALKLVSAMVSRHNLQDISQQLLSHLVKSESSTLPSASEALSQFASSADPAASRPAMLPSQSPVYRLTLAQNLLSLGAQNMYEHVTDFEWYVSVLVDLAYVARANVGAEIRDQLVDITGRLLSDDTYLHNASEVGGCPEVLWAAAWICGEYCGELAEPHKLLTHLLQPRISSLSPDIIAVYLQASLKVFGSWAADIADRWNDDDLPRVRSAVDDTLERLSGFVTHADIEVQERAAELLQLFTFIRADLAAYKPHARVDGALDLGDASTEGFGAAPPAGSEPRFPKSLYLIKPLFGAFELNAVAPAAQASVPVPEGLDLDAWIVPPPEEPVTPPEGVPDEGAEGKRGKKGKKKDGTGKTKGKGKSKGKALEDAYDDTEPVAAVETAEERAERERRKAERLERLRDDPYYLVDDRAPPTRLDSGPSAQDIDSIPVVRLDDLPPLAQGTVPGPRLAALRASPAPSPQSFVIDRAGEMPAGVPGGRRRHVARGTGTPSRFPEYDDADADAGSAARAGTPEPIRVVRAKKKGGKDKEKKRRTKTWRVGDGGGGWNPTATSR